MTAYNRRGVCRCGAEYQAKDRWQRSCDKCVAEKKAYQAAHPRPIRICAECGAESRETRYGLCPTCEKERVALARESWKLDREERRQQEARAASVSREEKPASERAQSERTNDNDEGTVSELAIALILTLARFVSRKGTSGEGGDDDERHGGRYGYGVRLPKQPEQDELVKPEQAAHVDQEYIDDRCRRRRAADLHRHVANSRYVPTFARPSHQRLGRFAILGAVRCLT
jgi:hypothetical protein